MSLAFSDRVALVTGAGQGIGQAIAKALIHGGATVHVCDLDERGVSKAAAWLGCRFTTLDLSDRTIVTRMIDEVEDTTGPIDILIHSAGGVCGQVGRPIDAVTEDEWRVVFQANVDSAFWLAQALGPRMSKRGYGRIVHIASGAGLRPSLTGVQAYTAAKHALVGLTKQLSQEFGPQGVTVNAVAPGFVLSNPTTARQWEQYDDEQQIRLIESIHTKRLGVAEDVAAAVLFFASESSGWTTGQILSVDGGRS